MKAHLLALTAIALVAPSGAAGWAETPPPPASIYRPFGIDLAGGDHSVKPGDNFDAYVNGTWKAHAVIDPDQSRAGVLTDADKRLQVQLRDIIQAALAGTQMGDLYRSFMDEARVNALDMKPLEPDLARVAAIPDKAAFARFTGETQKGFGSALFGLDIQPDPSQPTMNVLALGQAGLGLPDRDYYLKPQFKPQLDAYRAYAERLFGMIGAPDPAAKAAQLIDFETKIAQVSWALADRRDVVKTTNPMTLAGLQAYAPGFDWAAFLAGSDVSHPATIIVAEKSAIQAIAALVAETPLPVLKTWETFHLASQASPYLSQRFVDSRFQFVKALTGQAENRPRWKRGVSLVNDSLGELVGHAYVDRYFTPEAKAQMVALVANLKAAMHDRIAHLDWMSPSTKQEALTKLARMRVMVGYPDKWRDYSALRIDPADLYGNVRRSAAFEFAYHFEDLYKPVDLAKWQMTPQTVNAYNGGFENEIVFPAGFLQPPAFNPAADPAVNYGAIGAVIGHEISHGFDDQGRKIDADGKLRDWWTPADAKRFEAEAKAFGRQYDSYQPIPGMHLNGEQTMGENIADMAGLTVALDAYHRSLHGRPAPVIDGYSGDQRLFMGWAQVWREKRRLDALKMQIASDPHSPAEFRIIGPTRNIDAWYSAFKVGPTAKYYLAPADRTRIW